MKHWMKRVVASIVTITTLSVGMLSPAYAASTADEIGTSLYDVTTALTAYANAVVGPNTNDKHSGHTLQELAGTNPGIAGAIIGYGDSKKGFYGYISSSDSKAVTTSSYDSWLSVGDGGNAYAYARYGFLLNDLGLDESALEGDNGIRSGFGLFMVGCNLVASGIPWLFETILSLMEALNPFNLFGTTDSVMGLYDPNTGEWLLDLPADSPLRPLAEGVEEIYTALLNMGHYAVLPLMLVFLIWTLLMRNVVGKGSHVLVFVQRLAFITLGVPLLGFIYSSAVHNMATVTREAPATAQIVNTTFVDFEGWARKGRLCLPDGVSITSVGAGEEGNESGASSGLADANSVRQLRNTAFYINKQTGVAAGMSPIPSLGSGNLSASGGMWDTSGNIVTNDILGLSESALERTAALLDTYHLGTRYSASAWETAVNAAIREAYPGNIGTTDATGIADSNDGSVYSMYMSTDTSAEWLDRETPDNQAIFSGAEYTNGGLWSGQPYNIFANGYLPVSYPNIGSGGVNVSTTMTFSGSPAWGEDTVAAIPNTDDFGLSTAAMYNYLSSDFTGTSISVYSAANSSSNYVKSTHFAANLVGSGVLRFAYAVNCIAVLGITTVIGVAYALGMLISNLKHSISFLMSIPIAIVGVLRGIIQAIVYILVMVMEIIATVFLYTFVSQLIVAAATVIEVAVDNAITSATTPTSLIGGVLASFGITVSSDVLYQSTGVFAAGVLGMVLVLGVLCGIAVKYCRPLLIAYEYGWCRVYRLVTMRACLPAFDMWMARRKSLYVWDFNFSFGDTLRSVWGAGVKPDVRMRKGVAMA